jgi:hypothetical protein
MLLAVCVDGAHDGWSKLSSIADVAALLTAHPDADWAGLLDDAARFGHRRSVLVGIGVACLLLGFELQEGLRAAADRDAAAGRLAAAVVARIVLMDGAPLSAAGQSAFGWRTRERLRDRWRYATRLLLVPNTVELNAIALPAGLRWGYSAMRPARLAWDVLASGEARRWGLGLRRR